MQSDIPRRLTYMQFLQRENYTRHHKYEEEMLQFEYIKNGDLRAIDLAVDNFMSDVTGKLSDNPLRNAQYLFICAMTLTTRYAIVGGMEPETAYNTSDLFIQTVDKCKSVDEVKLLHREMTVHFTKHMVKLKKQNVFSKPIIICLDYIYENLHAIITVEELAREARISPAYLSTLFKKEIGMSVSEYIRRKRVEACENLLKHTDYSLSEISEFLAFSSYSHFASVFHKYTGDTPKVYRKKHFRTSAMESEYLHR